MLRNLDQVYFLAMRGSPTDAHLSCEHEILINYQDGFHFTAKLQQSKVLFTYFSLVTFISVFSFPIFIFVETSVLP